VVRPSVGVHAPPGAAFGAGSPLPFPLHPAEFHLCRMPRGRCASTRPHLCSRRGYHRCRGRPDTSLAAVGYFRNGAVVQASLLGDLAQREAGCLGVSECLAPRLPHGIGISFESRLGLANGLAGLLLGVGGHRLSLLADRHSRRGSSYPPSVSESPEQIRRHIEALSNFEVEYREFISALEEENRTGQRRWSDEDGTERKRAIQKNAVRADKAMKASGVGQWALTHPPAIGGGIKSQDLPSQVFDFQSFSYSDDGLSFQRSILERIPSQIAGLEVKLEEAEAAPLGARQNQRRALLPERPGTGAGSTTPGPSPSAVGSSCSSLG